MLTVNKIKKICENDLNDVPLGIFVSIIHRTRMMYLNNELKSLNVTASQFLYLIGLYKKEGQTQEDLATHFFIDKGTVARGVKKNWKTRDLFAAELIQKTAEDTFFTSHPRAKH